MHLQPQPLLRAKSRPVRSWVRLLRCSRNSYGYALRMALRVRWYGRTPLSRLSHEHSSDEHHKGAAEDGAPAWQSPQDPRSRTHARTTICNSRLDLPRPASRMTA